MSPASNPRPPSSRTPYSRTQWARRFAVAVAAWMLPVALVWILITGIYNRFLITSTENLVRLTEKPRVTRLQIHDRHHLVITRTDFSTGRGFLFSIRVTDTHFPLIMLWAFFLAAPGVGWRQRLENLGWATLIAIFFHIVALFFRVKFVYTTQLGAWSGEHYGVLARNFGGLSSHLLELPFKFALPFVLWTAFYVRHLLPGRAR